MLASTQAVPVTSVGGRHDVMPSKEQTPALTIRVDQGTYDRLDAIAAAMSARPEATRISPSGRISRSIAIREVIAEGLAVLEQRYGIAGK